jgi:putative transposase
MLKAFEYRLYPNKTQIAQINKHIGCTRWIYNYALEKKMQAWAVEKKNISRFDISNDLPILKKSEDTKWLSEVNAQSLQASIGHLDKAYTKFFRDKKGYPKFKSKHRGKQSFTVPQKGKVNFDYNKVIIPKIKSIKAVLHKKFTGTIKFITIKKTPTNKYYAVVTVDTEEVCLPRQSITDVKTLGIDLGIKSFITLSDGTKVENPKTLSKYTRKLVNNQRVLSRRKKGSNNRSKQKLQVAMVHEKIKNTRNDFLHKLSYRLTHENQVSTIVIEDLNVKGMIKNHHLAKSISDCSWGEFVRQLTYKSDWYGKNLIKIGRFEPSSKLCSNCGIVNRELRLSDREWVCSNCNTKHDRDTNAAINIKQIGLNPRVPMGCREFTLVESIGSKTNS